ncbi:hypothetical protein F0562_001987 [Nyssa sinensis]|uniref:Aminotransferase-like plant mobile domain-containing protein n=1 Tax=Nyssa sinensis TaxID=561372 RepID=A0A5J5C4I6_9ASTE|nr:hypothetical protein F0562_001987 [Nyssa sinensis]
MWAAILTSCSLPYYNEVYNGSARYNPHRVTWQFGFDQVVPTTEAAQVNNPHSVARFMFSQLRELNKEGLVMFPPRSRRGGVTPLWRLYWWAALDALLSFASVKLSGFGVQAYFGELSHPLALLTAGKTSSKRKSSKVSSSKNKVPEKVGVLSITPKTSDDVKVRNPEAPDKPLKSHEKVDIVLEKRSSKPVVPLWPSSMSRHIALENNPSSAQSTILEELVAGLKENERASTINSPEFISSYLGTVKPSISDKPGKRALSLDDFEHMTTSDEKALEMERQVDLHAPPTIAAKKKMPSGSVSRLFKKKKKRAHKSAFESKELP